MKSNNLFLSILVMFFNCNTNNNIADKETYPEDTLEGKINNLETGYVDFKKDVENYKDELKNTDKIKENNSSIIKQEQQKKQKIESTYLEFHHRRNLLEKLHDLKWIVHLNEILEKKDRDIAFIVEDKRFTNPPEKIENQKAIENFRKADEQTLELILNNNILNAQREFEEVKLKKLKETNYYELAAIEYKDDILKCLEYFKSLAPKVYILKSGINHSLQKANIQGFISNIKKNNINKKLLPNELIKAIYQIECWIGKEGHFYDLHSI